MTWKKGECGNPKGRPKNVPNKATAFSKNIHVPSINVVGALMLAYSGEKAEGAELEAAYTIFSDFFSADLAPRDRLAIFERFMRYFYPQQQSTSVDMSVKGADATLTARLAELAKGCVPADDGEAAAPK